MLNILQKIEAIALPRLQWLIVALSLIIAAQVQYIQHGWINSDSILYLEAAKLFAQGEWQSGFDIFAWPLYSLCIAATHKLTTLSIHHAAQLLNIVFFGIASASFLKIIELGGGKQRQIIAGALIWLSAQYMIGGALQMLMRDEGFWAFYLLSLVFFIQYYKAHQLKDALLWQVCIIIATLFRIEAILFLILLPLMLLFQKSHAVRQRIRHFICCNLIHIALAIGLISFIIGTDKMAMLGRLNEIFTSNIIHEFTKTLFERSELMSTQVLGRFLDEFATQGLLLTFLYVICVKTIGTTGIINTGLAAFAMRHQKQLIDKETCAVLQTSACIALINMCLIITKVFVLSSRYVLALSFILMLFASFYLADLLQYLTQKNRQKKWLVIGLIGIALLGAVKNVLPKRDGHNYQQQAASWLNQHNVANLAIFYDDPRMRYYANVTYLGRWEDNWQYVQHAIQDNSIRQYDLLVISHQKKYPQTEAGMQALLPEYKEIRRFSNENGKKSVAIYQK